MEWVEALDRGLITIVGFLKLILEGISALCILLGLITTLRLVVVQRRPARPINFMRVRLYFGSWLALALEFQLGADILATTIAPSYEELGQLAAIAIIRTFLNYFLNKELEAEAKLQRD